MPSMRDPITAYKILDQKEYTFLDDMYVRVYMCVGKILKLLESKCFYMQKKQNFQRILH